MTSKIRSFHLLAVLQIVLENRRTEALSVFYRGVRNAKTDPAEQGKFQELTMILRNRKPKEKNREDKESNSQIREMIQFRWRATLALQKLVPWVHSTSSTNLSQDS
jgi:hypothetical protein